MSQKKNKCIPLLIVMLFLMHSCTSYKEVTEEDQITVAGAWKQDKKTNEPQLLLKIANDNDYAVSLSFTVDYYMNGMLEETNEIEDFCLKAGKTRKGKLNGIILSTENFSQADIESEEFDWKVNEMEVKKIETCP